MNKCELCDGAATTHCDSDQAYLCWSCDYDVHSANFLVARHSRTILCHVCHSPTQWSATGTNLGPTVSVCNHCARNRDVTHDVADESVGCSDEDAKAVNTPPPAASSSSSSDCESSSSLSPFRRDRRKNTRRSVTDLRLNTTNPNRFSSGGVVSVKTSPAAASGGGRGARVKNLKRRRVLRSSRVGLMSPSTRALFDEVVKLTRC